MNKFELIYVGKDVLSLIVKNLDLVDILALKTTCTHFYMKLLKYKAIDKRNNMMTVEDFAYKLRPYFCLDINANLASDIIEKLSKEPINHLYDKDDFADFWGNDWQTEIKLIHIFPVYENYNGYFSFSYLVENRAGEEESVYHEFGDMESRLNKIVNHAGNFNSKYIYDCFSKELKQDFIKFGIDFQVKPCEKAYN